MLIIRNILDPHNSNNIPVIEQAQAILRAQFHLLKKSEVDSLPDKLNNYFKYKFQSRLIVIQNEHDTVLGFALMMHDPNLNFSYLDYIASGKKLSGKGLGGVLYEKVIDEAKKLNSICLLMECLPDDPKLCLDPILRKQNERLLSFYECYNTRPISGTLYETPVSKESVNPPYLLINTLDQQPPPGKKIKKFVRAILERRYGDICDAAYIDKVVGSFPDGEISIRANKYVKPEQIIKNDTNAAQKILLVANEGHEIHHVKERGYVESPVRIKVILKEMLKLNFVKKIPVKQFSDKYILAVHDADYVKFIKKASMNVQAGKSIYPYIFPIRNQDRKPIDVPLLSGYYCIDTFTPISKESYQAARSAVDCALTGAAEILSGAKAAYALVRPPGHHAERKSFGGFCYFSNSAIAANYLSSYGKVVILDIDYHHGNGQQDIFYRRRDVLTISIHGHPKFAYPYFTGFADEIGDGDGYGYNINLPLAEKITPEDYIKYLLKALTKVQGFKPDYLVIALGLDTAKSDPTGTWELTAEHYKTIGEHIGKLTLPTLVVQEGGYRTRTLGLNARNFFAGLHNTIFTSSSKPRKINLIKRVPKLITKHEVRFVDLEPIYELARKAKIFSVDLINMVSKNSVQASLYGSNQSGNHFILIERAGLIVGYVNFNLIPLTDHNFVINIIVIESEFQRQGFGAGLVKLVLERIKKYNASNLYVEIPDSLQYAGVLKFYKRLGFVESVVQKDFYSEGLNKVILIKKCQ